MLVCVQPFPLNIWTSDTCMKPGRDPFACTQAHICTSSQKHIYVIKTETNITEIYSRNQRFVSKCNDGQLLSPASSSSRVQPARRRRQSFSPSMEKNRSPSIEQITTVKKTTLSLKKLCIYHELRYFLGICLS